MNETLAMKAKENYLLLETTFSLQRSHSVQLIINTCDFLLKQLGMFFNPKREKKLTENSALITDSWFVRSSNNYSANSFEGKKHEEWQKART